MKAENITKNRMFLVNVMIGIFLRKTGSYVEALIGILVFCFSMGYAIFNISRIMSKSRL